MKATPLAIPDVILVEPKVFGDERGFFFEILNQFSYFYRTFYINYFCGRSYWFWHILNLRLCRCFIVFFQKSLIACMVSVN